MTDFQGSPPQPPPGTPPPPFYPYWVQPAEDGINLLDLLYLLRKRRKSIALVTFLGTAAAVAYALLTPPFYRAGAVIAPPEQKQSSAASAALAAFGGIGAEIAGSFGVSLGGNDANRLEALLKSHRVIDRVVRKNDLLPILFEDDWDPGKKEWTVRDPEDVPNVWDAHEELEGIYSVRNDVKAGVLRVSFEWKDTGIAERILRSFLSELALVVQEDELQKIEANLRFAETQLETATDPVIVAKLQALLSEQVEKAMMAQNVEHFAYELIDPPAVSDEKVRPKRKLIAVLGLTLSLSLGILAALFAEWLEKLRASRPPAT